MLAAEAVRYLTKIVDEESRHMDIPGLYPSQDALAHGKLGFELFDVRVHLLLVDHELASDGIELQHTPPDIPSWESFRKRFRFRLALADLDRPCLLIVEREAHHLGELFHRVPGGHTGILLAPYP